MIFTGNRSLEKLKPQFDKIRETTAGNREEYREKASPLWMEPVYPPDISRTCYLPIPGTIQEKYPCGVVRLVLLVRSKFNSIPYSEFCPIAP